MPLNSKKQQASTPSVNYLQQEQLQHAQHDVMSRLGTSTFPHKESQVRSESSVSSESRATNPLGARDAEEVMDEKRRRAIGMKIPVPVAPEPLAREANTAFGRDRGVRNVSSVSGNQSLQDKPQSHLVSAFDDTESFNFDDNMLAQDSEDPTMVFRGDMIKQTMAIREPQFNTARGLVGAQVASANVNYIEQEHSISQRLLEHRGHGEHDATDHVPTMYSVHSRNMRTDEADLAERNQNLAEDTPSRPRTIQFPNRKPLQYSRKTVSFDSPAAQSRDIARADSPELPMPNSQESETLRSSVLQRLQSETREPNPDTNRSSYRSWNDTSKEPPRSPQSRMPLEKATPQLHLGSMFDPSRESDCPTSEDELPLDQSKPLPPPPTNSQLRSANKRSRGEDLDYDVDQLRRMAFKDLDEEQFTNNPRDEGGRTGNAMKLPQRLSNLDRMSEEEQRLMFRSYNDEQWADVGVWFSGQLQTDLRRLMDVRAERRKISMRYEDEIRRRQKHVEQFTNSVDNELKELKKGGGELIKGRDPPSRKPTPQQS